MTRKAAVFANGDLEDPALMSRYASDVDLVLAADGGLRHALAMGIQPHVLIGDLDSAPNELVQLAQRKGTEIIRYPMRKDQTDLELALTYACEHGADDIVVLGGLGGRLDHALANILGLAAFTGSPARIILVAEGYELFLITTMAEIAGRAGDIVTLLPISETVTGVTTEGLEYPLSNESLIQGSSRGVSNVMVADQATISVGQGKLLAIHVRESVD